MTTHLLPDEAHLQELEAAASSAPWSIYSHFGQIVADGGLSIGSVSFFGHGEEQANANRAFVVASRNMVPVLLRRLAAERKAHRETEQILRAENERLRRSQFGKAWDEKIRTLQAEVDRLHAGLGQLTLAGLPARDKPCLICKGRSTKANGCIYCGVGVGILPARDAGEESAG